MNNIDLDTHYYTAILLNTYTNNYYFTLSKQLLINDRTSELLPYYRLGNWKTRELFKEGKLHKANTSLNKSIPISMVNRLKIDKGDIICVRLEYDIIWIEKINKPTINIYKFKFNLTRNGNYKNRLLIPSICRKILSLNSQTNNVTLDFLSIINNDSKIKNYSNGSHKLCIDISIKLINKLDLKEKELYCLLEKNKLTIIEKKENERMGEI